MRKRWPYKGGSLGEFAVKFEDPICTRGSGSDEELAGEKAVMLYNTVDANWAAFKPLHLRRYSLFYSSTFTSFFFIRTGPTYFKHRTISITEHLLIRFEKGNANKMCQLQ
jgi:hypothetical protein